MKRIWTICLLATAAHCADLTLWMTGKTIVANSIREMARARATKMLASIGVDVEWKNQKPEVANGVVIEVRFTTGTTKRAGAMAFANPFDPDPVVTVLYDRILDAT